MSQSVFKRARERITTLEGEVLKNPCQPFHKWDNKRPTVLSGLHEYQNLELANKPCDCGRMIYHEQLCGCAHDKWQIKEQPNESI